MTLNTYASPGAVKVGLGHFSGSSHVTTRGRAGLAAIVRDLAIQAAQTKVWGASISSLTDNTTGAAYAGAAPRFANLPALASATATGTLGQSTSSLTTSLGKIKNASAVLVASMNGVRKYLGLPLLSYAEGTVASANTIPAQDTSGTGASVGSTVTWASAEQAANTVENNLVCLTMALNEILVALGQPKVTSNLRSMAGATPPFNVLTTLPALASSTDGTNSVLVTGVTAFLAAAANAFASLAKAFNAYVPAPQDNTLTNSTGGASAAALAANALPAPANGAATTSAPKAGFDTQLGVIRNAISSMASAYNALVVEAGDPAFDVITDSTGGTVSSTLSSISASLTAVDGSSGTERGRRGHGARRHGDHRQLALQPRLLRFAAGAEVRQRRPARDGRARRDRLGDARRALRHHGDRRRRDDRDADPAQQRGRHLAQRHEEQHLVHRDGAQRHEQHGEDDQAPARDRGLRPGHRLTRNQRMKR